MKDTATDLPPVPDDPDPAQVAWLRGGPKEVLRVVLAGLLQRGHLELGGPEDKRGRKVKPGDRKVSRGKDLPDRGDLEQPLPAAVVCG